MPEAVTTQHEALWIGPTRFAMRKVPYLVSSPEIAGPVQQIDATNLASDRMIYIPGIRDYSGELVWEANAQYYRAGELRDLLDMDGEAVHVERRMPLAGVRISLEGTAAISLSAASPDSIQRITVRITPSSSMAVESWTPSMSDGYTVRIRTDAETHMDVVHVAVGYGGRSLHQVIQRSNRQQGAANIPSEWAFNGGVGPFGAFYAAFNIDAYVAGTESEEPICTEAGRIAYRLDPFHLKRSLAGTALVGTYNVLLVIPTVYWRVSSNDLYMTDRAATGYTAYAHTAVSDGETIVYPYIGIGVYEAYSDGSRLLSIPGQTPTGGKSHDQFKALADALVPADGCDFQQWNFYQWTLFKMMAYAVMGTKNSQWCLGNGPVSGSAASVTGLSDEAGPYADSTSDYDKVFIENSWGSRYGFVGDMVIIEAEVYAGQTLGGAEAGSQTSTGVSIIQTSNSWKWIGSVDNTSEGWDLPSAIGSNAYNDPTTSGDQIVSNTGSRILLTGGRWNSGVGGGINCFHAHNGLTIASTYVGARLSYFINAYALGKEE